VALTFERLTWPDEAADVVEFLTTNEWPFHRSARLSPLEAASVDVVGEDVAAFWIRLDGATIGMIRLFDLDDVEDGSPLFDLRLAETHRRKGFGRAAVRWLTGHLFTAYPVLHRIEATTRHDNLAMRSVLGRCGYRLEGRLREAWPGDDGTRFDSLVYAILRKEWQQPPGS
jgi:RimJ/RimL family protein N-acetyltransferase